MFYYCKNCRAIYNCCGYDSPSISYVKEACVNEKGELVEITEATGDQGESRTYCINDLRHDAVEELLHDVSHLSKGDIKELLNMFGDNGGIEIDSCSASTLARLHYLLKIEGGFK